MAEVPNIKVYYNKLYQNILNNKNNDLGHKFDIYLSMLEKELNDLQFRSVNNLKFKNETTKTNLKLNILEYLLISFVDILRILKIRNKDDNILRIKTLFKKKILDLSIYINQISKDIMKNKDPFERKKMIYNCFVLQNQLNTLYEYYETNLKKLIKSNNSNNSTKKLLKEYSNFIKDTMNNS
jgi:hypothetical protein